MQNKTLKINTDFNLSIVIKNNLWGIENNSGECIAPCIYSGISQPIYGLFYVEDIDGALGVVDITGEIILPPIYDEIEIKSKYEIRAKNDDEWVEITVP